MSSNVRKSVKVEVGLREVIEHFEKDSDMNLGETGGYLAKKGVEAKRDGKDPRIKGPFGIDRPFSKIEIGTGGKTEVSIVLDEQTVQDARDVFGERTDTANLRQAMRLGAMVEEEDPKTSIKGPFGTIRPFASADEGEDQ